MGKREIILGIIEKNIEVMGGRCPDLEESYRKMQEKLRQLPDTSMNTFFVTVSFDDTKVNPETLVKDIIRRLARAWVHDYQFCIEQRGENEEDIHGYHTHILIRTKVRNKSVLHIKREMSSWFKSMIANASFIDIRKITQDNGLLAYMSGDKKDPEKDKKVANDLIFRRKYKIAPIYTKCSDSNDAEPYDPAIFKVQF